MIQEQIQEELHQTAADRTWHEQQASRFKEKARKVQAEENNTTNESISRERKKGVKQFQNNAARHLRAAKRCSKEIERLQKKLRRLNDRSA